jgi:UDP-N-acetylglucosamine 3-dehydrogenase
VLRAAVIGCGSMGRNHLRVLAELEGIALVAAADEDAKSRELAGRRFNVPTHAGHEELLERAKPDFVVVAVPTIAHYKVAGDTLRAGVATLVEKPLAANVDEARALVDLAASHNALLAVGHVEHFNPAVSELKRRLDTGELGRVFLAHVRRLGPFPARVQDIGVVLDLATHDLDVLRYLVHPDVVRVFAETEQRIHTAHEDLVCAQLRFANGAIANLDINWLTPAKVRTLTLTGERGMFVVDYLVQDLYFYANDQAMIQWQTLQNLSGVSEGSMTRYKVEKREPLRVELEQFATAVGRKLQRPFAGDSGAGEPTLVTAEDGFEALRLATLIVESGRAGAVVQAGRLGEVR